MLRTGNYTAENRVHIFSFHKDEIMLKMWLRAISLKNLHHTKYSKVYERYFTQESIIRGNITMKIQEKC